MVKIVKGPPRHKLVPLAGSRSSGLPIRAKRRESQDQCNTQDESIGKGSANATQLTQPFPATFFPCSLGPLGDLSVCPQLISGEGITKTWGRPFQPPSRLWSAMGAKTPSVKSSSASLHVSFRRQSILYDPEPERNDPHHSLILINDRNRRENSAPVSP